MKRPLFRWYLPCLLGRVLPSISLLLLALGGCGSEPGPSDANNGQSHRSESEAQFAESRGAGSGSGDGVSEAGGTVAPTDESGRDVTNNLTPQQREAAIARATAIAERGDLASAAEALTRLLIVDPDDVEVLFRLAGVQAAQGQFAEAIETLDEISPDHPEAGVPSLGQSADLSLQLGRYRDAERRYRKILQ